MPRRLLQRDNLLLELVFIATLMWGAAGFFVWKESHLAHKQSEQNNATMQRIEKKIDVLLRR